MMDRQWICAAGGMRKVLIVTAAFFSGIWFFGCAPVVIGTAATVAGGYVWARGNLELTVEYPAVDLYTAARRALEERGIMVERDRHDRFGASLSGRAHDSRRVTVRITGLTEYSSRIRVRVGAMGDQDESRVLMNHILKNI